MEMKGSLRYAFVPVVSWSCIEFVGTVSGAEIGTGSTLSDTHVATFDVHVVDGTIVALDGSCHFSVLLFVLKEQQVGPVAGE